MWRAGKFFQTRRIGLSVWAVVLAGHYVPNLALAVVKFNEVADTSDRINIKGFMAGRPPVSLYDPCLQPGGCSWCLMCHMIAA